MIFKSLFLSQCLLQKVNFKPNGVAKSYSTGISSIRIALYSKVAKALWLIIVHTLKVTYVNKFLRILSKVFATFIISMAENGEKITRDDKSMPQILTYLIRIIWIITKK